MKFNRCLMAPLSAALLLSASSAYAQPTSLNAPMIAQQAAPRALAPLDEANWRAIRVKNVPPSMIAYMLDPINNKLPAFFNMPYSLSPENAAAFGRVEPSKNRVKGPFDLPDNLRLAASDEQNLLFVAGGDTRQIAQLQELVDVLDQPLRQVEIEAQMVELPIAELKEFGISTDTATAGTPGANLPVPGAFQVGFVRNNFQKRLDDLIEAGKAKVVSTTPLTLTNNMGQAVSLRSGPIDNTGVNQNKMPTAPAQGTDTVITLTPTINGDDTITVLMEITTLPKTAGRSGLMTVANVRDGDTIALLGLKSAAFPRETTQPQTPMLGDIPLIGSTTQQKVPLLSDIPMIGSLFRSKKPEDERTVLMFVTARIVR